jgi:nucleoside-diphosphate-sugar epimerase
MTINMPTICLIGGTGFLGGHLLKMLEQQDRFKVKILSRKPDIQLSHFKNVCLVLGDMLDESSLMSFLEPGSIVVNAAYMTARPHEDNLKGTLNLSDSCDKVGVARLIHVSTAVVVGRASENVITEVSHCKPVTRYEKTKLDIENALLSSLSKKCQITIVRPTEVFGEGGKGLLKLAKALTSGSPLINDLKKSLFYRRRLNLVCVDNVVAAIGFLISTEKDVDRQCFIVSDDEAEENNYYDVVTLLAESLGADRAPRAFFECPPLILSAVLWMAGRSNTNPYRSYSCEKLLRLGFRKPVSFQEGLKRFAGWYKRTSADSLTA